MLLALDLMARDLQHRLRLRGLGRLHFYERHDVLLRAGNSLVRYHNSSPRRCLVRESLDSLQILCIPELLQHQDALGLDDGLHRLEDVAHFEYTMHLLMIDGQLSAAARGGMKKAYKGLVRRSREHELQKRLLLRRHDHADCALVEAGR